MARRDKSAEELSVAFDGIEAEGIDKLEDLREDGLSVTDRTRNRQDLDALITYKQRDKSRVWNEDNTFRVEVHSVKFTAESYVWSIKWGHSKNTHEDNLNTYARMRKDDDKYYRTPKDWICEQVYELIQTLAE